MPGGRVVHIAFRRGRRNRDWFIDDRPKKERKWPRNLGTLILVAYSLFMTADWIYRTGAENGYRRGVLRGYEIGYEEGEESINCPQPWRVTMAAPTIIN